MSDQIAQIDALMQRHGIAVFEYRAGDTTVSLRRSKPAPELRPPAVVASPAGETITAPAFGRFYRSHPATAGEAPALPRRAKAGEMVGYLAVGPILQPVIAGRDCTLRRTLLPDGAIAGFGDALFEI
jgi:hypothetical protein